MSVATNYMTHFIASAEGYLQLEVTARGLADKMYTGLLELAKTVEDKSNMLAEFDKAMIDLETQLKAKVFEVYKDELMTMSKVNGYKNRKSEIRRGLKAGVDPTKHKTFSQFRKGTDAVTNGNSSGSKGIVPSKNAGGGAPNAGGVAKLHTVTNSLSAEVQKKFDLIVKDLTKLSEEQQLKVLQDCVGQIHKLSKAQARFGGAKSKTA